MLCVFISVYVLCTHKLLLMLVTAAFIGVGGLAVVVALDFVYC